MLKAIYDTQAEIPAVLTEHYKEKDGKWHLQVSGMKPEADITRLNTTLESERRLRREAEAKLTALTDAMGDDTDAETIREKLERLATLEASDKKPGTAAFEAELEKRVKQKVGPIERERNTLKTENEALKTTDKQRRIRDKLSADAKAAGIRDTAIDDVVARENMFDLDASGNVVTKDGVGVTPGLAPDVWLKDIADTKPHWFEPSEGGGARGNGGGAPVGNNPWSHAHWNITAQGAYTKTHGPDKAKQLMTLAGYKNDGVKPAAPVAKH